MFSGGTRLGVDGMELKQLRYKLDIYTKALGRLGEALGEEHPNSYVYDSAIQRFEFTYELAWKLLKALMEFKGATEAKFPRDVFREAYAGGLVADGDAWLDMLNDRNLTSHNYSEPIARGIYERIKASHHPHLLALKAALEGELGR